MVPAGGHLVGHQAKHPMTGIYTTTAPFILPGNPSWVWKTFTHNDTPYQAVVRLALEWGATAWDTSQAISRRNF